MEHNSCGAGEQVKQHLLSTYYVQGTLPDATKDTKIDETGPASKCLWKSCEAMFQYLS